MAPRKPAKQSVDDDVLATAHGLAVALHRVGAMDDLSMRDMDWLCLPRGLITRAPTCNGSGPRPT